MKLISMAVEILFHNVTTHAVADDDDDDDELQCMQWADTLSLLEFPPQAIHDLRTLVLSFRIFLQK